MMQKNFVNTMFGKAFRDSAGNNVKKIFQFSFMTFENISFPFICFLKHLPYIVIVWLKKLSISTIESWNLIFNIVSSRFPKATLTMTQSTPLVISWSFSIHKVHNVTDSTRLDDLTTFQAVEKQTRKKLNFHHNERSGFFIFAFWFSSLSSAVPFFPQNVQTVLEEKICLLQVNASMKDGRAREKEREWVG